jgi:hypothetical protein
MKNTMATWSVYSLLGKIGQHFLFNCSAIGDGSAIEDVSHPTSVFQHVEWGHKIGHEYSYNIRTAAISVKISLQCAHNDLPAPRESTYFPA